MPFHFFYFLFPMQRKCNLLVKITFSHIVKAYVQYNSLNAVNLVHAAKMSSTQVL